MQALPSQKQSGARSRAKLSPAECEEIASTYDGSTARTDALLNTWRQVYPDLKRHNIAQAAKRGGYVSAAVRKAWSAEEDAFLRANWHKRSGDEIAQALGRTFTSVNLRQRRIGVGAYEGDELTVGDVEELTGIDHRQWKGFIARGWLKARERNRRNGATPITYIAPQAVRTLFAEHPEVYDYSKAPRYTSGVLDLGKLPPAPRWKRVTCNSDGWSDGERAQGAGPGHSVVVMSEVRFKSESCAAKGGTSFWAPTYSSPCCPRCGCTVSRYSDDGVFTDLDPGEDEIIAIQALKLGLVWRDGGLLNQDGTAVKDRDLLECVFSAGRRTAKSLQALERVLNAGMSMVTANAVEPGRLLPDILPIKLRADQEEAFASFLKEGAMTAAHAMSFGKSTLGMVAVSRLSGRHFVMVDTVLLGEQWVSKLKALAPRAEHEARKSPRFDVVKLYDAQGALRSVVEIYNYRSRLTLEGKFVVGVYDEVHRLPAAMAHRHAYASCEYRMGLSSTPDLRCDGRGALVHRMTGNLVGQDWGSQIASGLVKRVPVKVLLVDDLEHKHEVVGALLQEHRSVAVLCEAVADGMELERRYGIPFIYSKTKNKLEILASSASVVLSRVGDAGLSLTETEVTVDHTGLHGSRIRSLQRLGRLMHSQRAKFHAILMTEEERHGRLKSRVDAIQAKGFVVTEERVERDGTSVSRLRANEAQVRVSAQDNPFLSALGWMESA